MNKSSSSNITPKPKRTLGLSRSINPIVNQESRRPQTGSPPNSHHRRETTSGSSVTSSPCKDVATAAKPNRPTIRRVSNSANSRIAGNTSSSQPTNIRRHRLSLCKETNEVMTRQRVKRALSQQSKPSIEPKRIKLKPNPELNNKCDDGPESSANTENCDKKPLSSSETLLQMEIDRIRKQISTTEKYQQETSTLQDLIVQWRAAGLTTIDEIKEKFHPTEDETHILAHFNIDPGLFHLDAAEE